MQYTNTHLLPLWYKNPLDQFIKRNFSSNSAHLTEHDNNTPPSKVSDLSSTSKQAADTTPVTSEDLDSGKKFDEAIHKANYPQGAEGAAKVDAIVDKIKTERAAKVDKMSSEIETDKEKAIQDSVNRWSSGEINAQEHIEEIAGIESFYVVQKREHYNSCDIELRELMEVVFDYKKDNNIPLQDSSDIDSSTDMPGPMDDE